MNALKSTTGVIIPREFLHFIFALIVLPFQTKFPELVKLAFSPYLFYLVYKRNALLIPALMTYVLPGTTMSFAILVSVFIVVLLNTGDLLKYRMRTLFVLSIIPFPFLLYNSFEVGFSEGLVRLLLPYDYYLGLFLFFYGILLKDSYNTKSIKGIVIAFFILSMLGITHLLDFSVRLLWYSYPFFLAYLLGKMFAINKTGMKLNLMLLLSLIHVFSISSPKFTLLFAGLLGALLYFLASKKSKWLLSFVTSYKLGLLFLIITGYIINANINGTKNELVSYNLEEKSYYESWDVFKDKLYFKAFGDRAPIWVGGWKMLLDAKDFYFIPPKEPLKYDLQYLNGLEIDDNDMAIHNLALELMRNYGIFLGVLIFALFLVFLWIGPGKFLFFSLGRSYTENILVSVSLATGFVGSLVGQYPLMSSFSVVLMSLCGVFYAHRWEYKIS